MLKLFLGIKSEFDTHIIIYRETERTEAGREAGWGASIFQ